MYFEETGFSKEPSIFHSINFAKFFNMIENIGSDLNGRKERFLKSDFVELGIQTMSEGKFVWTDNVGYDHLHNEDKIESKSQMNCLKTDKGGSKEKVANIKLMNSLGDASQYRLEDIIKFDILLLIDTGSRKSYSSAYINSSDITEQYLKTDKDGVYLVGFPMSKCNFIYDDVSNTSKVSFQLDTSIKQRFRDLISSSVEEFYRAGSQ